MVMTVGIICLTVAASTSHITRGAAPWMRPPMNAAMKIQTPGVLIHVNVTVEGSEPEKIVTELENWASHAFRDGTSFEVASSSTKIKIKHDHARRAPAKVAFSVDAISMRYSSRAAPGRRANNAVTISEHREPTTTVSSGPTNAATAKDGSA